MSTDLAERDLVRSLQRQMHTPELQQISRWFNLRFEATKAKLVDCTPAEMLLLQGEARAYQSLCDTLTKKPLNQRLNPEQTHG